MCGRSANNLSSEVIARRVNARNIQQRNRQLYRPSTNVAPGSVQPVLCASASPPPHQQQHQQLPSDCSHPGDSSAAPSFDLCFGIWGLDKFGKKMTNTRSENLCKFKMLGGTARRLVYVCEGYYEWRSETKQPFYFCPSEDDSSATSSQRKLFYLAAVADEANNYSVVTVDASPSVSFCHDRMPAMLSEQEVALWVAPDTPEGDLMALLRPRDKGVHFYPVSKRVGSSAEQGEALRRQVDEQKVSKKITSFFKRSAADASPEAEKSGKTQKKTKRA